MKFINKGEYKHKDGKLTQKNGYYISTDAANNKKPYERHGWHVDMLEDAFFSFMPILQINLKDRTKQNQEVKVLNERLAKLEHDMEQKEKTIDNYKNDLEDNASTDTQRKYAYEGIEIGETFITEARSEIDTIAASKEEINKTEQTRGTISEWLKEWKARQDQEEFRRAVNAKLRLVIDKILVYGGGFKLNPKGLNKYLSKLESYIYEYGNPKGLPTLNTKSITNLNEETYADNHMFLDLIIRKIIKTHLPSELQQEAWDGFSLTRIPDTNKDKRFFVVFPKNSDGAFFQIKPDESFNIGHVNKYIGRRWYSFGGTMSVSFNHGQGYYLKGYNPIYRKGIQYGESRYACKDYENFWYDGLPDGYSKYEADWKDIV
jgi:hypothetical protein